VLLSLGYPVTEHQRTVVSAAMDLIAETNTGVDAILVPDVADVPAHLRAEDTVAIVASGLELRRIERVVRSASADDRAAGG
jgi:hypothetical protein